MDAAIIASNAQVFTEFLANLHIGADGNTELRTLHADGTIATRIFSRDPEELRAFAERELELRHNVYHGCATRKPGNSGKAVDCLQVTSLWAELDSKTRTQDDALIAIRSFPLRPSIIINSGGGWHLYWLLTEPHDAQDSALKSYLRGLALALDGDLNSAEIARILRPPGTFNFKPQYPEPRAVALVEVDWDLRYELAELAEYREQRTDTGAHEPIDRATDAVAKTVDDIADDLLLKQIKQSKQGAKFTELWTTSTRPEGGTFRAASSLCSLLAAWSRANPERVARLFKLSAMYTAAGAHTEWWDRPGRYAGGLSREQYVIQNACKFAASHWMFDPSWPAPEPLGEDLPAVPPFEIIMLPAALRPMVEDISERTKVPLDLPASAAIVALAAAVNRRARIQPKVADSTWCVIPNLWGCMIAPPGHMKSPIMDAVMQPLHHVEAMWRASLASETEQYERELKLKKMDHEVWQSQYKAAKKKNLADLPIEPDITLRAPVMRRLIVMDATPEKLHEILEQNPAGLLVLRDELTGLLAEMDKLGRETQRSFFLQGWNGYGCHTIDRIERGTHSVPNVCLSVFGLIQPSRLRWYLNEVMEGGPSDDGLFQRFQVMVWPEVSRDYELIDRPPNNTALACAEKVLSQLANLPTESVKMRFTDEAQPVFNAWLETLEKRIRGAVGLPLAMVSHLAKFRSLMPSLAGLFELADRMAEDRHVDEDVQINLCHVEQAVKVCAYLEAHAARVYACVVMPEMHAARELAKHIERGALGATFTTRQVYMNHWASLDTPEHARGALTALADAGWIRTVKVLSTGGRPPETWEVNPAVEPRET